MKVCTKCHVGKPVTDFRPRPGTADGLRHQCRACQKEAEDSWRKKNPERVKANCSECKMGAGEPR